MRINIENYGTQIEIKLNEDAEIAAIIDAMIGSLRSLGWHQSTIDNYIIEMADASDYGKRKSK